SASGTPLDRLALENSGDITVAGDVLVNSDRRLKTEIRPIDDALSTVSKIHGKTYRWDPALARDDRRHTGLIAQEVESVVPELVTANGEDGIKSVNYRAFVPILITSVNTLGELKDRQEAEIRKLRRDIATRQRLIDEALREQAPRTTTPTK
ncbi:MAG: tail fiber domain-containing protein, partial [bacterium]|nr:tail fiber domain-containing protein [bacterium]